MGGVLTLALPAQLALLNVLINSSGFEGLNSTFQPWLHWNHLGRFSNS